MMLIEDVRGTVAFYREVLGFELVMTVPETAPFEWALVRRGEVELMFGARAGFAGVLPSASGVGSFGSALTLYIDTEEVAALYGRLRSEVEIVHDLHVTSRGTREFSIRECNGFILTFGEELQRVGAALRRPWPSAA